MSASPASRRIKMRVEMVFEGVHQLPSSIDHPVWLSWKVSRSATSGSGETQHVVPERNHAEFGDKASFKAIFKAKDFREGGYVPKLFVLTLKGRRGRMAFTLGTVTLDLAEYVTERPTTLHLPFESASKALPSTTEFRGKLRVCAADSATEPLDASSTMADSDDDDQSDEVAASSMHAGVLNKPKVVFGIDELSGGRAIGAGSKGVAMVPVTVAHDDAVRELKRRHARERREADARHRTELDSMQLQLRAATVEHEQRVRTLEAEAQRRQDASSAGALLAMRSQLEEVQNQSVSKNATIQTLRDQLSDAQARLVEQSSVTARTEAALRRLEADYAAAKARLADYASAKRREVAATGAAVSVRSPRKDDGGAANKADKTAPTDSRPAADATARVDEAVSATSANDAAALSDDDSADDSADAVEGEKSAQEAAAAAAAVLADSETGALFRSVALFVLLAAMAFLLVKRLL